MYSKVIQLYVYAYSLSDSFPFRYCRMLSIIPCTVQHVLAVYLFYV